MFLTGPPLNFLSTGSPANWPGICGYKQILCLESLGGGLFKKNHPYQVFLWCMDLRTSLYKLMCHIQGYWVGIVLEGWLIPKKKLISEGLTWFMSQFSIHVQGGYRAMIMLVFPAFSFIFWQPDLSFLFVCFIKTRRYGP